VAAGSVGRTDGCGVVVSAAPTTEAGLSLNRLLKMLSASLADREKSWAVPRLPDSGTETGFVGGVDGVLGAEPGVDAPCRPTGWMFSRSPTGRTLGRNFSINFDFVRAGNSVFPTL